MNVPKHFNNVDMGYKPLVNTWLIDLKLFKKSKTEMSSLSNYVQIDE